MKTPPFSVVVASLRARPFLAATLESLVEQCAADDAELLIARRPVADDEGWIADCAPRARVVRCPADASVPEIRGAGLALAGGEWSALTEDSCRAVPGWLRAFGEGASAGHDVIGGVVGNAATARSVDWGAYFSEYGLFGPQPPRRGRSPAMTGANVAYRFTVRSDVARWASAGDWEHVIHARLRERGARFAQAPDAQVLQQLSDRLRPFLSERYEHGREYARVRSAALGRSARMLLAVLAPALPPLLAARIWRATGRRVPAAFARALPSTLLLLAGWSVGEAVGYLLGPRPR